MKTAAALLSEVRRLATPRFDPAPVSAGVEDMAPMTPLVADDLLALCEPLTVLAAAEARTALQALALRPPEVSGPALSVLTSPLLDAFPTVIEDRPLGPEIEELATRLRQLAKGLEHTTAT